MTKLGYTLSSEEFGPQALADQAKMAEEAGFAFASIADHFHPWLDSQGHSPFVWGTLGAISQTTSSMLIGTGVTCPMLRTHPAIIAQAAATAADLLPGRFYLGVGTGEALNEHILGQQWPPVSMRRDMLAEAVEVIQTLWSGDYVTMEGEFYRVDNARIYTLPKELPPIYVAAGGPEAAELAAEIGEGLIATSPDTETVEVYKSNGGTDPIIGQLTVCWGDDEDTQAEVARHYWANAAIPGQLSQELAIPLYFEQAAELVTTEKIKEAMPCGPDIDKIAERIDEYVKAGFTHVYLHQVGPDQREFIEMARTHLLPRFNS
jgi:G6PDH family F420-dependent oxidoreductase